MKTNKLLLAAAAFAGLALFSFAGPGPEFWGNVNSQNKPVYQGRWASSAVPAQPAPAVVAANCATCSCCAKKS
jgi:hypothetical protein